MPLLKAAFFTEAGTTRGMGHLIRSYCIYKEFHNKFNAKFYLDSDIDFSYKFEDIINFKWENFKAEEKFDIIFIDSYIAKETIYKTISNHCKVAVYLDDYGRLDYPKGVIINFAPDASELFFSKRSKNKEYLLGPKYVPIRKEFLNQKRERKEQIFISFGGSCSDEVYLKVLGAIKEINIQKIVISNSNTLTEKCKEYKNIKILNKPSDEELIEQMANSSMAITTASMVVYELSYFKIPNIIVALSKNQEIGASQLINHKLADFYISFSKSNFELELKSYIKMFENKKSTKNDVIDGQGVNRIIKKVLEVFER